MLIVYICIFFIGASVASFINATLYRIENNFKFSDTIFKNSHCEMCKKTLAWYELIPIIGYILISGKCTKCGKRVNIYYPVSEMFLGISTLLFYLYQVQWYYWIILIILFILSYFDIKYMSVPKNIVHTLLGFCIIIYILFSLRIENLIAPISISILLLLMNIFKKSFGLGDILVLLAVGILLSYKGTLIFFWIGIFTALVYSIAIVVIKKVKIKKAKISMIPFFSFSFLISCLFGDKIFDIILKFLQM